MCVGLINHEDIQKGQAKGVGNTVMYVGASTGRDGIHGATFASEELSEGSEAKRPAVQVGDPFMEKLLLEACLELVKCEALVGIQEAYDLVQPKAMEAWERGVQFRELIEAEEQITSVLSAEGLEVNWSFISWVGASFLVRTLLIQNFYDDLLSNLSPTNTKVGY